MSPSAWRTAWPSAMPTSSTVWWSSMWSVALRLDGEVDHAVARDLVEHVVEEADTGRHLGLAGTIEIDGNGNIRLLGACGSPEPLRMASAAGDSAPRPSLRQRGFLARSRLERNGRMADWTQDLQEMGHRTRDDALGNEPARQPIIHMSTASRQGRPDLRDLRRGRRHERQAHTGRMGFRQRDRRLGFAAGDSTMDLRSSLPQPRSRPALLNRMAPAPRVLLKVTRRIGTRRCSHICDERHTVEAMGEQSQGRIASTPGPRRARRWFSSS